MTKPTIPAWLLAEHIEQVASTDEELFLAWARRLELPINENTRATFRDAVSAGDTDFTSFSLGRRKNCATNAA